MDIKMQKQKKEYRNVKKTKPKQKLKAREIVLLAVMISFCVVSNILCSHTIPLHAGTAIVVLSGISLGPAAGFVVGAIGRFICNFFDGQGLWTPSQMFSWGLIGAISGISFSRIKRQTLLEKKYKKKHDFKTSVLQLGEVLHIFICLAVFILIGYLTYLFTGENGESFWGWWLYAFGFLGLLAGCILKRKKLPCNRMTMAVFAAFVVFIIYGGIMNISTMLIRYIVSPNENPLNLENLKMFYITGVPYDISHALGTALCIFFIGESLLQKLERIQIKYGIFKLHT